MKEVCKWCNGELPDKNWCLDCCGSGKVFKFPTITSELYTKAHLEGGVEIVPAPPKGFCIEILPDFSGYKIVKTKE